MSPRENTILESIIERIQKAESEDEVYFILTNELRLLLKYRSAYIFKRNTFGKFVFVYASGLAAVERKSAFGTWSEHIIEAIHAATSECRVFSASDFDPTIAEAWLEYWPNDILYVPINSNSDDTKFCLIFVIEDGINKSKIENVSDIGRVGLDKIANINSSQNPLQPILNFFDLKALRLTRAHWAMIAAIVGVLVFPIRQFVIVPVEIMSSRTLAITAPLDGIVSSVEVDNDQRVHAGELLFSLDDTELRNRLTVSKQGLEAARADYLTSIHQFLSDTGQATLVTEKRHRIEEYLIEIAYLEGQIEKLNVVAEFSGIALIDQESDWAGQPVSAGMRVMELTQDTDLEVWAWIPIADPVTLQVGDDIRFMLYSNPLHMIRATVTSVSYMAHRNREGVVAYTLKADIEPSENLQLGARGSAKINGGRVPLIYMALKTPLIYLRQRIGF